MTSSTRTPDQRRGPLIINIAQLLRRTGSQRDLTISSQLDGLSLSDSSVAADEPVVLDLVLEALPESISVSGSIVTRWQGTCRRCLDATVGPLELAVSEIYERLPEEGQTYPFEPGGDAIDLEPLVRESVLLSLPWSPLCSDDCAGPPDSAYAVGVERDDVENEEEPPRDPRWAALDGLDLT